MRPKYKLNYVIRDLEGRFDSEYHFKRPAMKRMLRLWGICVVFRSNDPYTPIKRYETV